MIFTTYWFICFAAACIGIFWLLPRAQYRRWWLAVACLVFHAHFAGPAGVLPILVLMVITFYAGITRKRGWCSAAMAVCVAALFFYKYALFIIGFVATPLSP